MKRYKPNFLFTPMFQMCSMFLTFFPGLFIMLIIYNPHNIGEALYIFPAYAGLFLFAIVLCNTIHFIICLFKKHVVFIDETMITVKGNNIAAQSMRLEEVKHVVFDQGEMTKTGHNKSCSITLYNESYQALVINNPSFLMICELQRRLKKAKFKFNNYKWYIIWGCASTLGCLLLAWFGSASA